MIMMMHDHSIGCQTKVWAGSVLFYAYSLFTLYRYKVLYNIN